MMAEDLVVTVDSAPEESEGMYEPPIMDVCDRAAMGAMTALYRRQDWELLMDRLLYDALHTKWIVLVLAGAESCERRSFTPQAVFNRWVALLAELGVSDTDALEFRYEDAEPFFDLYAALLSRMWGWLTRRRMLAAMRTDRVAQPVERLRWEDAEPIVRTALGAAYQPPDTPEKREALRRWAERVKDSGGKPTKAMTAWIEAWRTKPEKRGTLISRALAWKDG